MLQSNKRYKERNIKRIPKKVGVKVMEIKSILIKDTTREERKQIVEESFGNISASCDGCMAGLTEMYQTGGDTAGDRDRADLFPAK